MLYLKYPSFDILAVQVVETFYFGAVYIIARCSPCGYGSYLYKVFCVLCVYRVQWKVVLQPDSTFLCAIINAHDAFPY